MHERIKILVTEAFDTADYPEEQVYRIVPNAAFCAKFAELIVKECCDKIEREYKYARGEKTQWSMSQDVQELLKTHFGVDE